jgi:rRNA maturation RNase YbeY
MIQFHAEDVRNPIRNKTAVVEWLENVAKHNKKTIAEINYIFCSDEYLLQLNKQYLNHSTLTDIITFDYTADQPKKNQLAADIFISTERVRENAEKFEVAFTDELHRVLVHGLLHLCGFKDKTAKDQTRMRTKENESLHLRNTTKQRHT